MKVVVDYPPNIDDIDAVLHVKDRPGILYCYGDTIYNPGNEDVPLQLHAHEQVHSDRQGDNPGIWWHKYLSDSRFRFEEELLAYKAEWEFVKQLPWKRTQRQLYLNSIAERLTGSMYGNLATKQKVKELIRAK